MLENDHKDLFALDSRHVAKVKELGGTLASDGSFSVARFDTREGAEKLSAWLTKQYYQVRSIIAPNNYCKFFVVSYR